jgi:uncharacterized repeat protein (TIGR03803 family)
LHFQTLSANVERHQKVKASSKNTCLLPVLIAGLACVQVGQARAQIFTNLHNFTGGSDGATPSGALVLFGNKLYGTSIGGGSSGYGTVFMINTNGTGFTNLYSFTAPSSGTNTDGANPQAGLVLSGITLYGMTVAGGKSGNGTVFRINTDGSDFTNFYSFDYTTYHAGRLCLSNDTLYGVTDAGGSNNTGTIFKLNTNGTPFSILHNFSAEVGFTNGDGAYPLVGLVLSGDTLYGTTGGGGTSGGGTVFRLSTDGTSFTNLHSFAGKGDGWDPEAGLTLSGDTLFGATDSDASNGDGVVYKINTDGSNFSALYHFSGGSDGAYPSATLFLSGNSLYGTTLGGGASSNGVVFTVNTDGSGFGTLYNFSASSSPYPTATNSDGASILNSVVSSGNTLYGAAYGGGSSAYGTLFCLLIRPQLTIIPLAGSIVLNWPTNAAGFTLQSTPNLFSPVWTTNLPPPVVVNGQNTVTNPISGAQQFFRLSQ